MTRKELIAQVATRYPFTSKKFAKLSIDVIINVIEKALISGEEVTVGPLFGKFVLSTQAAKSGVVNGVSFKSPSKRVVKFKPSKHLRTVIAD